MNISASFSIILQSHKDLQSISWHHFSVPDYPHVLIFLFMQFRCCASYYNISPIQTVNSHLFSSFLAKFKCWLNLISTKIDECGWRKTLSCVDYSYLISRLARLSGFYYCSGSWAHLYFYYFRWQFYPFTHALKL